MSDVTRILAQIEAGDLAAAEQLLPLVYDDLRKLAAQRIAQEKPGQTLQGTALVHEAYLRLVASPDRESGGAQQFNGRGHFFAAAAEAMRRILIDQARRRKASKRGGDAQREELHESAIAARPAEELLAVDEILDQLAEIDPLAADIVKLRFYVGLNMSEVAEALGISVRKAQSVWAYARTWLHQKIAAE